jgi:pimeloyl-ACP methyl ester carboxylesterase
MARTYLDRSRCPLYGTLICQGTEVEREVASAELAKHADQPGGTASTDSTSLERDDVVLRGTVAGSGDTALLLHAGGESRRVWAPIAGSLAQRGVRTVAYDLRGHGDSGGHPTALEEVAGDVAAMIRSESNPVAVVGASLGGLAAIAALGDRSVAAQVTGLMLVDVVPDPDPQRTRAWLEERQLGDRAEYSSELVEDILGRRQELLRIAAGLERPLALAWAGVSPVADDDVDRLRAANPRVTVHRVPAAGHLVARDAPDELARIIHDCTRRWAHVGGQAWLAPPEATLRRAFDLQDALGARSTTHPGGTVLAHLERVHALTVEWSASRRAQLAAISHATYGTDGFPHALLPTDRRDRLAEAIGADAERLVYLYGACDRSATYARLGDNPLKVRDRFTGEDVELSNDELVDFAVLTIANELDVARHAPLSTDASAKIRILVRLLAPYAGCEAAVALDELAGGEAGQEGRTQPRLGCRRCPRQRC